MRTIIEHDEAIEPNEIVEFLDNLHLKGGYSVRFNETWQEEVER